MSPLAPLPHIAAARAMYLWECPSEPVKPMASGLVEHPFAKVTSMDSLLWSLLQSYIHIIPPCTVVDCGNLSNPRFGKVVLSGTVFGSTATYSCQPGYILVGQSTRSCQADGDWSGRAPVCRRKFPSVNILCHKKLHGPAI